MPAFRVGMWYSEGGHFIVEAKNLTDAEEKVEKHLEAEGLENLPEGWNYSPQWRQYFVTDCIQPDIVHHG